MITILGSTGFVGSALMSRLRAERLTVSGLSRPYFDLGIINTYSSIPEETRILIHSAGPAGPEHSKIRYWKECVQATYDLVDFINSKRTNIELLVYVSSGAVYKSSVSALTVNSETGPGNLYGMTRLLSETIITKNLNCGSTSLRLFFPYGPGQKCPRLIPELIRKIKSGEEISLNRAKGLPIINPIYIDDLCSRIVEIMKNPNQKIHNLGGNEAMSIKTIAQIIGELVGKEPLFQVTTNESMNFYCSPYGKLSTSFAAGLQKILEDSGDV